MIYTTCTNGLSVSRGESCWLYLEIPAFLKQLTMVISSSVDHDCSSIIIASSIVMFANSLSESIALIYFRITLVWYLSFNDRITPWSIVCVTEVVFGNEKIRSVALGVQGNYQLWILPYSSEPGISNSSILSNLWRSLCLSSFLVSFVLTWQGLTFLKYLGYLLFPMTNNDSFSRLALVAHILVSLTKNIRSLLIACRFFVYRNYSGFLPFRWKFSFYNTGFKNHF